MKNLRYIFLVLGIGLIIALGILLKDYFDDTAVWVLDLVVSCVAYSALFYSFSAIMAPAEDVSAGVAGMGIRMWVAGFYTLLAVGMGVAGFFVPIDFKWQLLVQIGLLVVLASGLFGGMMANQRLNQVEANSQLNQAAKLDLSYRGQQLKLAAIGMSDTELQRTINKLADRMNYITPSHSPMAITLDDQLAKVVDGMVSMLSSGTNGEALEQQLQRADMLLKQRMQTY